MCLILESKGQGVQPSSLLACEAASSSRAIGSHFPVWSRGILPQISGFLFIGFLLAAKSPGAVVALIALLLATV